MAWKIDKNSPWAKKTTNITTITDSSGGTASTTIAAITAGASYAQADIVALKNAVASIAAQLNKILTTYNLG